MITSSTMRTLSPTLPTIHYLDELIYVHFTYSILCKDIHALMRVMWSGKWAVVTPHAVLNAIWQLIPSFSGYSQQDAQEFLWYVTIQPHILN